MESKISLRMMDEERDEERQPLNAMVTENLKNIIIRRIYKDVEKNVTAQKKDALPVFHQYLAALGPIFVALSSGMSAGYSAILLPQLMVEDSEITITKDEGSWIASMMALPLIFGCLVSGYLMDILGRKYSQILSCIPFTIGWVVLAFAPNVPALYVGRLITGFCVGLMAPMCQVYIAETSRPESRGILLSGSPLSVAFGIFAAHGLGTFLSWRITAGICGTPPLISILVLLFAHESPSWLLSKGKVDAAKSSYRWFNGDSEEVEKEFNVLLSRVKNPEETTTAIPKRKLFLKSSFLKPFLVLNFFFLVQQFSGVNFVAFYSVSVLKDILTSLDEYVAMLAIDVVRLISSVVGIVLLKRFGRKPLSVVSAAGTAVSLFSLAIYLGWLDIQNVDRGNSAIGNLTSGEMNLTSSLDGEVLGDAPQSIFALLLTYLPLVFLVMYISFLSIGLVPLPWVLTGELFSKEMRGIGSGVSSSFGFLCLFVVVKLTPDFFELMNTWGTFCMFGVVTLLGSIILGLFLPETKDKTLAEIEAYYKKKKPSSNNVENGGEPAPN